MNTIKEHRKPFDVAKDLSAMIIPRFRTESEGHANSICDALRKLGFQGKRERCGSDLHFTVTCLGERKAGT